MKPCRLFRPREYGHHLCLHCNTMRTAHAPGPRTGKPQTLTDADLQAIRELLVGTSDFPTEALAKIGFPSGPALLDLTDEVSIARLYKIVDRCQACRIWTATEELTLMGWCPECDARMLALLTIPTTLPVFP